MTTILPANEVGLVCNAALLGRLHTYSRVKNYTKRLEKLFVFQTNMSRKQAA